MSAAEQRPKPDLDAWAQSIIGKTIAEKYAVVSEIGRGGMGGVFLARHSMLGDREFAIKLIIPNPEMGTLEEQEKRFAREAASALSFVHSRAVQVRDFGFDHENEVMYMAMDYVRGRSLKDIIEEASATKVDGQPPIPTARALSLTLKMLDALKSAHKAGIVHRDLKPGNIMVVDEGTPDEDVQIMDFGFAKLIRATEGREDEDSTFSAGDKRKRITSGVFSQRLSTLGKVVGTPQYMAPEQARGKPVDPRADLYALGVILYEMLTGALPHTASSAHSLLVARASSAALSLTEIRPDIDFPPEVQILTEFALSVDPADRFQSASRFAASIIEALDALGESVASELQATQEPATGEFPIMRNLGPPGTGAALPVVRSKSRGSIWAALAGAIAVAGALAAALLLSNGDHVTVDHLASARAAMSLGKYDVAIEALEAAVADRPDDTEAAKLLRHARVTRALAEVRRLAEDGESDDLKKAIDEARKAGAEETDLEEASRILKIKRGIAQIETALKEGRFTQAAGILEGLPGSRGLGLAGEISSVRATIETKLGRAKALLAALDVDLAGASGEQLASARRSLQDFVNEFPNHPKVPQANSTIERIRNAVRDRATRISVSIATLPSGLECKLGETYLGTSPLDTTEIPEGEHTIHVVDTEGFVSAHALRVTAGRPVKELFDHGKAVAAEAAAYRAIAAAGESPIAKSDACRKYLAAYPAGAKRDEVKTLLRSLTVAAQEKERLAEAAYKTMSARLRTATPRERAEALSSFVAEHGDSKHGPEVRARIARLELQQTTLRDVMTLLDDYETTPEAREDAVRRFVAEYPGTEFASDRTALLRALLVRHVKHDGKASLIAGAGASRFCVYSAQARTVSLHQLPTGKQTAEAPLTAPMAAMDGFQDGRVALAEREGGVVIWAPPVEPRRVVPLKVPARTLIALADGNVVACSGRPGDALVVVPGSKSERQWRIGGFKGGVLCGCRSTDGRTFVLGTDKGEVIVLAASKANAAPRITWKTRLRDAIASVSLAPSNKTLAVGMVEDKRVVARVFGLAAKDWTPRVSYPTGHSWMQAVDDAGTIVAAGRVLLPGAPGKPVSIRLGARPAIDSFGRYLVSAAPDGKAVVSYLPELLRQAAKSVGVER